ncbi:MAG: hypothetical protein U5Q44_11470 [Dehalococcoidia bacterium]|nr:hypothetical protein [Dehalococcoidia bacterium]
MPTPVPPTPTATPTPKPDFLPDSEEEPPSNSNGGTAFVDEGFEQPTAVAPNPSGSGSGSNPIHQSPGDR